MQEFAALETSLPLCLHSVDTPVGVLLRSPLTCLRKPEQGKKW